MNPQFPVYIVSKGRHDTRLTSRAFERMRVPYRIVVEEQEFSSYASVIDRKKILVLDKQYQRDYDAYDQVGDAKSKGSGGARNFVWDHAIASSAPWHWIVDDNIQSFYRLNRNLKHQVEDGTIFRCMEDFILRFSNIGMAGPNYEFFVPRKHKQPPFILNTRIYSCNLIRNDTGFRWRGRFNEDTDLSLRLLKAGWCTILFNAFLQKKVQTLKMRGGNTDSIYVGGTLPKSQMIVSMHPDVSKLVWRYGRWHHAVDYSSFSQVPVLKDNAQIASGPDDYGMKLKKRAAVPKALAARVRNDQARRSSSA